MATPETQGAVIAFVEALLAADILGETATLTALTNMETPEPPKTRGGLAQAHVYLQFPPHKESARCMEPDASWTDEGAFIVHVLVASNTEDAVAQALMRRIVRPMRNETLGGVVDILGMFGADAGPRFGGNWWGVSIAVEYAADDI